jgi:glutamate/tyrosine decarboxylase-like PLP-dependent enzyme
MVDDMLDHLETVRARPAWTSMPAAVRGAFDGPIPWEGEGAERVYEAFRRDVLPYPNGNIHPRFWGWVQGTGTPLAMLADMLASGLNPNVGGFDQAPVLVEKEVLRWLGELMGFPEGSTGLLVGGGTMANVLCLNVARFAKAREAGFDIREEGLQSSSRPRLLVYGSTETHTWARRAVELLGLGNSAFRHIRVDSDYRIDIGTLKKAIDNDRAAGHLPFCVIATAGTVNTGATDNLNALADLCRLEHLWFHVDGAFGALARLSENLRPIVSGIERADSIGFDLHKWMYLPFDVACVLVRDPNAQHDAFAVTASYLTDLKRGVHVGGLPFSDRGIDLSRSFRALKIWMSMKAHGVRAIADIIEQNVDQARYLGALVEARPDMELLAPIALNVVCFRYAPAGLAPESLDAVNREILQRVQEQGIAVPSGTIVQGHFAIRAAITNHRSRREDFEALVAAVAGFGNDIAKEPV